MCAGRPGPHDSPGRSRCCVLCEAPRPEDHALDLEAGVMTCMAVSSPQGCQQTNVPTSAFHGASGPPLRYEDISQGVPAFFPHAVSGRDDREGL